MRKRRERQVRLLTAAQIAAASSAADVEKLFVDKDNDLIYYVAEDGTPTQITVSGAGANLSVQNLTLTQLDVASDTGTDATIQEARAGTSAGLMGAADKTKMDGIESGAEVNNITDANATDLTDGGDTALHYHTSDRNRANHTGTQTASTISDFDTEVSNNSSVSANNSHRTNTSNPHATDIGNLGSGTLAQLNAIVTDATLDDSSATRTPSAHTHTHTDITDFDTEVNALISAANVYDIAKYNGDIDLDNFANVQGNLNWTNDFTSSHVTRTTSTTFRADATGTYKFTISVRITGNNRVELILRTFKNGVVDNAEIASNYVIRDTDQNTGGFTHVVVYELTVNDTVRWTMQGDADGTCVGEDDGTNVIIERVK